MEFDLNIGKILENWEVFHALREIISNALDEQYLTKTKDIIIFKDEDAIWHIRDFGRGINYHHLTQSENEEKKKHEGCIGRFGVGLKDALATLYRNNIKTTIRSKHGIFTIKESAKAGFADIVTLHADILPPIDTEMEGTDFLFEGCSDTDIEKAKSLFLKFSKKSILETTVFGDVIENGSRANIYVYGVKVAEEPNFLFSYNITSMTASLRKALNRERSNVGRSAYTDRVKDILKRCTSKNIINKLVEDLQHQSDGLSHDEMQWTDIQIYASSELSKNNEKTTFITTEELAKDFSLYDEVRKSGMVPVIVSKELGKKLEQFNKKEDVQKIRTSSQYYKEENDKYKPNRINLDLFSSAEKTNYLLTDTILSLIGGKPACVKEIEIVDKLYDSSRIRGSAVGLWRRNEKKIQIQQSELSDIASYAGTLLHECAHAISGAGDVSREFEGQLTHMLGAIAANAIKGSPVENNGPKVSKNSRSERSQDNSDIAIDNDEALLAEQKANYLLNTLKIGQTITLGVYGECVIKGIETINNKTLYKMTIKKSHIDRYFSLNSIIHYIQIQ